MSLDLSKILPKGKYSATLVKKLQKELDKAGIVTVAQAGNIPVVVRTSHGADLEQLAQDIKAGAVGESQAADSQDTEEVD